MKKIKILDINGWHIDNLLLVLSDFRGKSTLFSSQIATLLKTYKYIGFNHFKLVKYKASTRILVTGTGERDEDRRAVSSLEVRAALQARKFQKDLEHLLEE